MPYFVFKVFPNKTCEQVAQFDQYKEARNLSRNVREKISLQDNYTIKIMHAENSGEAEGLVLAARERPILMEHEK